MPLFHVSKGPLCTRSGLGAFPRIPGEIYQYATQAIQIIKGCSAWILPRVWHSSVFYREFFAWSHRSCDRKPWWSGSH